MAQAKVVELGSMFWKKAIEWCRTYRVGTQKDMEIMTVAASIPLKIPSDKQSLHLMNFIVKMKEEGCPFVEDI